MVTKTSKGLVLGLEARCDPTDTDTVASERLPTTRLPWGALCVGKSPPPARMDECCRYELAKEIKTQGVKQPVLVRPRTGGGCEAIASERRSPAARLASLDTVSIARNRRDLSHGDAWHMEGTFVHALIGHAGFIHFS